MYGRISPLRRAHERDVGGKLVWVLSLIVLMSISAIGHASEDLDAAIKAHSLADVFPGAHHAGKVEGDPPAAPVFQDNRLVGYIYLTSDVVNSAGYSGKPVKIMAGLSLSGKIVGAVVYQHEEPILVLGIPDSSLSDFIGQFAYIGVSQRVRVGEKAGEGEAEVDMVTGATITSHVFADSIMRAGRLVARSRGLIGKSGGGAGELDIDKFDEADWSALLADGSIRQLHLTQAQVATAFSKTPNASSADKTFIDLYAGLATPARIGQNLFGFTAYNAMIATFEPGDHPVFVAGHGFYSFRGYAYRRSGFFERLQLVQGENTFRLTKAMHRSHKKLAIGSSPELREISLFVMPASSGFDPAQPWRLELLVEGDSENTEKKFAGFSLNYTLPDRYLLKSETNMLTQSLSDPDRPLWQVRWADMLPEIVILCIALAILLIILVFQDWLVSYRVWIDRFRVGFLVFTLIFIGWITAAQLSVINVLTFAGALLTEFRWDFFLLEPLIFILWGFVAAGLLFLGRGVFCGWLCPFGALQELLNRIAVHFNVRQFSAPFPINERLFSIKYVIFLGLFALSLGPVEMAAQMMEVEPFKTVIALKFVRAWPFVVYAVILLVAGLFVNRMFCRYLCPLGAALAIPANNRMFDWLKRRHQCGAECQVCAIRCPVQAIHPDGHIDLHECIYCLDCQSIYHDDHFCPPLVEKRKRRERRLALSQAGPSKS